MSGGWGGGGRFQEMDLKAGQFVRAAAKSLFDTVLRLAYSVRVSNNLSQWLYWNDDLFKIHSCGSMVHSSTALSLSSSVFNVHRGVYENSNLHEHFVMMYLSTFPNKVYR